MSGTIRLRHNGMLAAALLAGIFATAGPAAAQTETTNPAPTVVATGTSDEDHTEREPYWYLVGGFEGDTHHSGYGFIGPGYSHPINDTVAWTAHVDATYLYYSFNNSFGGRTRVHSPGLSPAVGLKFGRHGELTLSAGLAIKHRHVEETDRTGGFSTGAGAKGDLTENVVGGSFSAQLYKSTTKTTALQLISSYGTADSYWWNMGLFKVQVGNRDWHGGVTPYLGVEGIEQGNGDIRSYQVGGVLEMLVVKTHTSIGFRGGYKTSSFPNSPGSKHETGPYFGVTLYNRF